MRDRVVPFNELRGLRVLLDERGDRAPDEAPQHHDPVAELARRELELLDGLFGGVHRDDGRRDEAIGVRAELVHGEHVVGAAQGAPQLVRRQAVVAKAGGRIDHGEVEPEIVQALVEEPRHHRGRAVQRVFCRQEPERFLPDPPAAALGHRHRQRIANARARQRQRFHCGVAADTAELLAHVRARTRPSGRPRR